MRIRVRPGRERRERREGGLEGGRQKFGPGKTEETEKKERKNRVLKTEIVQKERKPRTVLINIPHAQGERRGLVTGMEKRKTSRKNRTKLLLWGNN